MRSRFERLVQVGGGARRRADDRRRSPFASASRGDPVAPRAARPRMAEFAGSRGNPGPGSSGSRSARAGGPRSGARGQRVWPQWVESTVGKGPVSHEFEEPNDKAGIGVRDGSTGINPSDQPATCRPPRIAPSSVYPVGQPGHFMAGPGDYVQARERARLERLAPRPGCVAHGDRPGLRLFQVARTTRIPGAKWPCTAYAQAAGVARSCTHPTRWSSMQWNDQRRQQTDCPPAIDVKTPARTRRASRPARMVP